MGLRLEEEEERAAKAAEERNKLRQNIQDLEEQLEVYWGF